MWQIDVPLADFYDAVIVAGREAGYMALLTALVRDADSPAFYDDISRYWNALHDVTGPDVLFVLAGPGASSKIRWHGIPDKRGGVAYSAPSAAVVSANEKPLRADLSHWVARSGTPNAPKSTDVAEAQTRAVGQLRRRLGIAESQLPCFHLAIIGHRRREASATFPLTSRTVYETIKHIVSLFDEHFTTIRGLEASAFGADSDLDSAWESVFALLSQASRSTPDSPQHYQIFIAYDSDDRCIAEYLHTELSRYAPTFLDVRCLLPGDRWVEQVRTAQEQAEITVLVVGAEEANSWFQQTEYLRAIELARTNRQRLIPVYTRGTPKAPPYGLEGICGIVTTWASGMSMDEVRRTAADIAATIHKG
jgi:hypothetical protein